MSQRQEHRGGRVCVGVCWRVEVHQQRCYLQGQEGKTAAEVFFFFCCAGKIKRMLCLLSIQYSFFTRTLLHMSMRRATEGVGGLPRSVEKDILPSGQIWPPDWWPRVASSLSQWPHMQGVLVRGRSVDCENAENRVEDKKRKRFLPADIYSDCNQVNVFVCVRGRMEARTVSLDWLSLWSAATWVKHFGCFCLFPLAPKNLEKIRFHPNLWRALA